MDRITALRARRTSVLAEMETLLASADVETGDMTAEAETRLAAVRAEDDRLHAQIEREVDMERRRAAAAKPIAGLPGMPPRVPALPKAPDEKGLRFARIFRALAAVKGQPMLAAQYATEAWGDDQLFANQNISTGAAGGFLVPEDVSAEVIELLRPASVVMSLGPMMVPMPNGNITMNRLSTGASASYIGEQQDAPATTVGFGQVRLSAKKLAALIPVSNDLIRMASVAADRIVRDDIVAALAQRTDLAFIRSVGSEFTPRGLRWLAPTSAPNNVLAMTPTPTLATVTQDLGRLRLALRSQNVPLIRPGFMLSPRTEQYLMDIRDGNGNFAFKDEMQRGLLRGAPYGVTTQIPENLNGSETEVYFADFAQVVVGETMGITVDTSTEAAYIDSGSTMRAAFSRDETVMRAIAQHDINLRHLAAVAVLTGVTWQ